MELLRLVPVGPVVLSVIVLPAHVPAQAVAETEYRPGARAEYRIERRVETARDLGARFTAPQRAILEKLNRADAAHLHRQDSLVVPSAWYDDELQYSPFPLVYAADAHLPKLLVVDLPGQAFAAYEDGQLVRWGPVSSGRRAHPTPSGWFHLNWRSRGRHSTVNPEWYMEWYFNFDNARGLALHAYVLPGYPASRACIRLLARDAIWIHEWGDEWVLGRKGQILAQGTPLLIVGQYAFDAPPPWRSPEQLAHGIDVPQGRPPVTPGAHSGAP
ncbi:MAG: L,D-transpeptidase family protein [Acidobacteria bacterium]|nr:L,D-transpeptidase family protein [Acidobacteriota bacterium]